MNAYEKLEIHQNPEYTEHLKNAEALDVDLFDKEKILAFGKDFDIMPEEVKEKVLEALDEIKKDEGYTSLCKAIYYFMKNDLDTKHLTPDFEEGTMAEFAMFFPVWYMAEEFAADSQKRGVPKDIVSKSLAPICGCIKRNAEFKGRMGTSAFFFWIPKYAKGELFRLNDFEYETAKYKEQNAVGIHIPSGTKLDVHKNLLSFKEAMDFFDKYYPELEMTGMVCESWLLSDRIEEVMGKPTNISRFGDMFDRYDIGDTKGDAVFRFVYGFAAPYPPVEDVPEDTTLQKKLKAYMLSGKRVYALGGFIPREKLISKLKEFEG